KVIAELSKRVQTCSDTDNKCYQVLFVSTDVDNQWYPGTLGVFYASCREMIITRCAVSLQLEYVIMDIHNSKLIDDGKISEEPLSDEEISCLTDDVVKSYKNGKSGFHINQAEIYHY